MWNLMRTLGMLALTLAIVLSLTNPSGETQKNLLSSSFSSFSSSKDDQNRLQYDFYSETCPQAEQIIRTSMKQLYTANSTIVPQLLRLLFHDCFVGGCDASVLLDENSDNERIEKDALPNETLKGFEKIEIIKSRLEEACPGTVSCADTLVLATREGIVLAGGPFYPLFTGRKDSTKSYYRTALADIPSPKDNISRTLARFRQKGFNEKETVILLGAHNIGSIDCKFIRGRLYNFSGTGQPDPTMPLDFLEEMRASCSDNNSTSNGGSPTMSPSPCKDGEPGMGKVFYQSMFPLMPSGTAFDTHYYQSLLRGRGLLFADQQLMARERTASLVRAYASDDGSAFRRDFARAMVKMSSLIGNISKQGSVRFNCSKIPASSR